MSFVHAAFLAASLAIAAPWLLHLTQRRKYLRVKLGSLQFLQPLVRQRKRMRRIEDLPLLLLRCLAILLLALVFARPFFSRARQSAPAHGEVVLLLDASGSITPAQADEIRAAAADTLDRLDTVDRPVLAAISDEITVLASLDDYRPQPGAPGDFSRAVDWVVDRAASGDGRIAAVHWFTDRQKSSLPPSPSRLWPSQLRSEIHDLSAGGKRNASIDQIELLTPFGIDEWEVQARVRVHGMPGDSPLQLRLTTRSGDTADASVPPAGGSATFRWHGAAPGGLLAGEIAIDGSSDPWPADDRRAFAFTTSRPRRIALVDFDPSSSRFTSESYFLATALHASSSGKALSPYRASVVEEIPPVAPAGSDDQPDAIALCNPPGLSSQQVRLLQDHLRAGAGIAIFLGDDANASAWSSPEAAGLLPAGLRVLPSPGTAYLRQAALDHPALAGLTESSLQSLRLAPLARRFAWDAGSTWQTILAFNDGSPLLQIAPEQRVAVMAQQVNREGSNFPLDPSFVPLMQNLFGYLGRSAASADAVTLASVRPGVHESRPPGLYDETGGALTIVAADPAESEIATADAESFRNALGLPDPDTAAPAIAASDDDKASSHLREGELWPWLIAVLLLLLAAESVFAARRPRPTSTPDAHAT